MVIISTTKSISNNVEYIKVLEEVMVLKERDKKARKRV